MPGSREKSPVEELVADVEAHIDEWFQGKLPFSFRGGVGWFPATDVYETEDAYRVTMALPGIRPQDVSVKFRQDTLRVRGVRHEDCSPRRRYHKMEIPVGPFERSVRLPKAIKVDEISIDFREGLLDVSLPKMAMSTALE